MTLGQGLSLKYFEFPPSISFRHCAKLILSEKKAKTGGVFRVSSAVSDIAERCMEHTPKIALFFFICFCFVLFPGFDPRRYQIF